MAREACRHGQGRQRTGRATWSGLRDRWAKPSVPPGPRTSVSPGRSTPAPVWRLRVAGAGGFPRARGPHERVALVGRAWRSEVVSRPPRPRREGGVSGQAVGSPSAVVASWGRSWEEVGGGAPQRSPVPAAAQQGFAGDAQ